MNKFLVVVDMQNDFINGSLGSKEAQAIVPAVVSRIKEANKEGYNVILTMDTHSDNYIETNEGKHLPVRHCINQTNGWALNKDVFAAAQTGDYTIVEKPTFGSLQLPDTISDFVTDKNCDVFGSGLTIELIGLCTDICVVSNALLLKANYPEAIIQVRSSCCAGVTPELHEAALKTMASCQIDII